MCNFLGKSFHGQPWRWWCATETASNFMRGGIALHASHLQLVWARAASIVEGAAASGSMHSLAIGSHACC